MDVIRGGLNMKYRDDLIEEIKQAEKKQTDYRIDIYSALYDVCSKSDLEKILEYLKQE